jgi:hypothetical protein
VKRARQTSRRSRGSRNRWRCWLVLAKADRSEYAHNNESRANEKLPIH